jgi:hypothetical protein
MCGILYFIYRQSTFLLCDKQTFKILSYNNKNAKSSPKRLGLQLDNNKSQKSGEIVRTWVQGEIVTFSMYKSLW